MANENAIDLTVELPSGSVIVEDVDTALELLTQKWPAPRGSRHRDAEELCLKVVDGHRSVREIPNALRAAAEEAGLKTT